MEVKVFGVVGAGQMGNGIAQVAAASGLDVIMNDIKPEFVDKGLDVIAANLERAVAKGRLGADEKGTPSSPASNRAPISRIWPGPISSWKPPPSGKTSNSASSGISTGNLSAGHDSGHQYLLDSHRPHRRPDRTAGQGDRHAFHESVPVMKLVEVIRGLATSEETFTLIWSLSERFGKIPAEANDFPGFIANRILMPMINEAVFCLYHGVGEAEAIDTVMKLGMNHPMGPLALADLIGLDTCLAIMETLYNGFSDSKYRPCPLLRKYVEAGWLGRKSGRGFYRYDQGTR